MDISIIIPCHNLENYIQPLLSSFQLLNLDSISAEFIFVLDDCTDKTKEIIEEKMQGLNFIILEDNFHSCGLGRNLGMTRAQGDYIWFVDGDDWIIYYNVLCDCITFLRENDMNIIQLDFISNYFRMSYYSMVWQYIFKREFIQDILFDNRQPQEDDRFMQKVFQKLQTTTIPKYDVPVYFYNYLRPGSNMTQFYEKGYID